MLSPIHSLIVSFAILHELTHIVPTVGISYMARGRSTGECLVMADIPGESTCLSSLTSALVNRSVQPVAHQTTCL
ncbi:hypothetical protein F4604DRAFT_1800490 [Suillus subluteus]|nr:hypothetical protein F4604DRAFT_1800490 [Suillus subluteus]